MTTIELILLCGIIFAICLGFLAWYDRRDP